MLFDLTDLRLFIHVADCGSLTKAAERMHLSLGAASGRMKEMETRFGTRLLYRENKGVQLSPAGETLLKNAQQLMQQVEKLKSEMQAYNNGIKGYVRIFANTTAVTEFMPQVLGRFLAKHPHVNVALEERLNQDIVRGIQEGTADVGIASGPVNAPGLTVIPFATDRLVLATPPKHPLSRRKAVSFADTLDFPHIGLHEGSTLHDFLNRMVNETGAQLKLRIQVRGFEAMCRMVSSNVGIAMLPHSSALRLSQTIPLALVELTDPWALRERSVVVQDLGKLPHYARELIETVCEAPEAVTDVSKPARPA